MDKKIEISLSNYFTDEDLRDLNNLKLSEYTTVVSRLPQKEKNTGGLAWEGIVIFIAGNMAEGFLAAIGEQALNWIKKRLFEKKKKLKPQNIERFTFNMPFNNGMFFFDFTNITTEQDFTDAINTAKKAYDDSIEVLKQEKGYYDFTYDTNSKSWVVKRNKSFDI